MAKNFKQHGEVWDHVAASNISSGQVLVLGLTLAVALADIAEGEEGAVQVEGVFELPKLEAAVVGQGVAVYWDASANQITLSDEDTVRAGTAAKAAGAGATSVWVKLNA